MSTTQMSFSPYYVWLDDFSPAILNSPLSRGMLGKFSWQSQRASWQQTRKVTTTNHQQSRRMENLSRAAIHKPRRSAYMTLVHSANAHYAISLKGTGSQWQHYVGSCNLINFKSPFISSKKQLCTARVPKCPHEHYYVTYQTDRPRFVQS